VAVGAWLATGGAGGRPAAAGESRGRAVAVAPATAAAVPAAAAAPAPAAPAPAAPVLSRADSVAIARAVAREFERAMTQAGAATGAAAGAATAAKAPPAGATVANAAPEIRPPGRVDSARQRRAAREVIVDSLTRAGAWQHVPREVMRTVVGRLPMEWSEAASPEERRSVEEAIREAKRKLHAAGLAREEGAAGGTGPAGVRFVPVPLPPAPPGDPADVVHSPWPGFAAVTARLRPPAPGVRRAALVATVDETDRADLGKLADLLDAALRTRLRAAGSVEVTNAGVAAVARHERVPDAVVARGTGADAVLRTKLRMGRDDEVRATLYVRASRTGPPAAVEARVPLSKAPTLSALADSLAGPLARGAAAALAGRDPRAATP
jgi:hypothetical protein